ncbi:uroporphyrinogen-III C-methyltransferase [Kangiella sediminilitoris]|uniref:HemX domain protein n=1 Tax=Kangiella sediminilitoris TaxID=1144748 RepID=A0A1B3B7R5_9GAMM|nr:uroporphyrinogen-III C-methyltransferase [Kangiella sediminilitoris]AOE48832.1 hypothetical protein KS2013_102 [Kangiella sediminilitoris]
MSKKDKEIIDAENSKDETSSEPQQPETDTENNPTVEETAADSAFEENSEDPGSIDDAEKDKAKSSSGLKFVKLFIFLVVLAAIAYAVYFGWEKWQDYQTQTHKADQVDLIQQQLKQQQQSFESALQQQKNQMQALQSNLSQSQARISQLQQQLSSTQSKIQALSSNKQQDWLFNEAQYLLREASNKLSFTNDAASIISLLQAADSVLSQINDGSLTDLRQAISRDINAVRSSGNLDIEGVAIAIETLKSDLLQLELASIQLQSNEPQADTAVAETDISSWQHFKNSISKAASKYYTVHHFEESVRPFISPERDRLLRENIALNLQTAQLAALQNNQSLYLANLQQVNVWVAEYFKQKSSTTSAFIQQLEELLEQSVELNLPSQLQSYKLISELSKQKVDQWLEESETANEESTQETSTTEEEPSA